VSTNPNPFSGALAKQADTGAAGFTLVNGTPTILTWAVPNDGKAHQVLIIATQDVTLAETGGGVGFTYTAPDGSTAAPTLFSGGAAPSVRHQIDGAVVQAGSTVTVVQSGALTAGAAVMWATIWGS
jgi:hypothetical protein